MGPTYQISWGRPKGRGGEREKKGTKMKIKKFIGTNFTGCTHLYKLL